MSLKVIVIIIGCCLQASCCTRSFSYPVISDVTKIQVARSSSGQIIKEIDDNDRIEKVIRFIDERRARWCGARFGSTSVPSIALFFQQKNDGRGEIGFGRNFFIADLATGKQTMEISDEEARDFLNLVGINEQQSLK